MMEDTNSVLKGSGRKREKKRRGEEENDVWERRAAFARDL